MTKIDNIIREAMGTYKKEKEIRCNLCGELIGWNEEGEIPQPAMFCKNRPHRLYFRNEKENKNVKKRKETVN